MSFPSPSRAIWEITWRCDIHCEHCLLEGGDAKSNELSTERALELVEQLGALGVRAVTLTGGEPLLRRDWTVIAQRVRDQGMALRLSSNGHLLDDRVLSALEQLGAELLVLSLDGLRNTHNRIRHGPSGQQRSSSFDNVLGAIDRAARGSIPIQAITTVVQNNLDELPAIHRLLKQHGVTQWLIQLGYPTGRLAKSKVVSSISPRQLPILSDFLVNAARDPLLPPMVHNSVGYLSPQEPLLRQSGRKVRVPYWKGCHCGISSIGIEPDGGIKGCANQIGEPFVVGNVNREPLSDIWNDRQRWHWLHLRPESLNGGCTACALGAICQAGCTALAFSTTGSYFDNPYCLRAVKPSAEGPIK